MVMTLFLTMSVCMGAVNGKTRTLLAPFCIGLTVAADILAGWVWHDNTHTLDYYHNNPFRWHQKQMFVTFLSYVQMQSSSALSVCHLDFTCTEHFTITHFQLHLCIACILLFDNLRLSNLTQFSLVFYIKYTCKNDTLSQGIKRELCLESGLTLSDICFSVFSSWQLW